MLEQIVTARAARQRIRECLLSPRLEDYASYLHRRGHTAENMHAYVMAMEHFARWLQRCGLGASAVDAKLVSTFLDVHLPHCRCRAPVTHARSVLSAALRHWLRMLDIRVIGSGKSSAADRRILGEVERYDAYLRQVVGLATATRYRHRFYAKELLGTIARNGKIDFDRLTGAGIVDYIVQRAGTLGRRSVSGLTGAIRSYLKFLHITRHCPRSLVDAVPPPVRSSRLSTLPIVLADEQLRRLLRVFDRTTAIGERDYAIARCLVDLGLRTCEVAGIRLQDIDWRAGVLYLARGKLRRVDTLPLPQITGQALAHYVRHARPETVSSSLFVHHQAPRHVPIRTTTVRGVMRRAFRRAGIATQRVHVLRQTLATRMLRARTSLKQIADVLRHRRLETTSLYCKVDFESLVRVALPWPGRIR